MDPCAGLHILAHGSIPLPYLPNLCAVLRPAPLASYYFPFLSFPLLSPCIGLSLGYWCLDFVIVGFNDVDVVFVIAVIAMAVEVVFVLFNASFRYTSLFKFQTFPLLNLPLYLLPFLPFFLFPFFFFFPFFFIFSATFLVSFSP